MRFERPRRNLQKGEAELPGVGVVRFDGLGGVKLLLLGDHEISVAVPAVAVGTTIKVWGEEGASAIVIYNRHRNKVASVELGSGSVALVDLCRHEDADFWSSELFDSPLGPLLVFELGVIAFNMDGSVRWRADLPSIQWMFDLLEDDRVTFWHEFEGNRVYSLSDGTMTH